MTPNLTALQADLLAAFFRHEKRFRLTGGAALAGFHLGHRTTKDLDLFTREAIIDDGSRALVAAAHDLGATVEDVVTSAGFRRRMVRRGPDAVLVDLVESSVGAPSQPMRFGDIVVDGPVEILANKLCTLLSRAERRDLVDVFALEDAGHTIDEAFPLAMAKDAGLTPGQLAAVLGEWQIGDDARIPGGLTVEVFRARLQSLLSRLARLAFPHGTEDAGATSNPRE